MSRGSSFAAVVNAEVQRRLAQERKILLQLAKDAADIAASEAFQLGPGRVQAWDEAYREAIDDIVQTTREDGKDDKALWFTKDKLDRRLQKIRGERFVPWPDRYGGLWYGSASDSTR